jgi:hypothetical protein
MKSANYPFPILIMRDGRRLFAGNEQRKGDGDFYDDDASISMEGQNTKAIIYSDKWQANLKYHPTPTHTQFRLHMFQRKHSPQATITTLIEITQVS